MGRMALIAQLCEIAASEGSTCPTCGSPWPWEDFHAIVRAIATGGRTIIADGACERLGEHFSADHAVWQFIERKGV